MKNETKWCPACKKTLSVSEFGTLKASKDRLACKCKKCMRGAAKIYRTEHKDQVRVTYEKYNRSRKGQLAQRNLHLQRKYKITHEEYMEMFEKQKGLCVTCGKPETCKAITSTSYLSNMLCVDHDHNTGKVRGLLCRKCNLILGNVGDDKNLLLQLAIYLERH